MAYVTGSVNNLADLLTAIRAACTANGWTLSGEVLHKGGVYVRTQVVGSAVTFLGGTGIDGSNVLTGGGPAVVRLFALGQAFTFPMTYEVHINTVPDEVYIFINYAVDFYEWAAFGQSSVAGLPGSGVWYAATKNNTTTVTLSIEPAGVNSSSGSTVPTFFALLSVSGSPVDTQNCFVQHGLDGETWNPVIPATGNLLGYSALVPLLSRLPNAWNSETVLLPVQAWRARSSGNKVSLVADLAHVRHCRIDFHDPGDVITFGSDQWKLYPCYRKNAVNRDGGTFIQHSGTFGLAVRYTGP